MSTCISSHGEFGEHTLDDLHTCTRCHVLDEDALRAELAAVKWERDLLAEALGQLRPAAAAVDWHREYGVVLVRAMRQRDEARRELHGQGEHAAQVQALDVVNAMLGALNELNPEHEEAEAQHLDAELADINRRVEADKRVLDAAEAWHDWHPYLDSMFAPENALMSAVRARRALVEVEDTPQPDHDQATCPLDDCERCLNEDMAQWAAIDAEREQVRQAWHPVEATPQPAPSNSQPWELAEVHCYVSTACHHGLHDKCRLVCKYCDVGCSCEHHEVSAVDRDGEVERDA